MSSENIFIRKIRSLERLYRITCTFSSDEKFSLISQLRRASVSIALNLSEGTSRNTNKNKAHFTTMSFSSAMEVLNPLIISKELNFISENDYILVRNKIEKITNMLNAFRNSQLNR